MPKVDPKGKKLLKKVEKIFEIGYYIRVDFFVISMKYLEVKNYVSKSCY